MKASDLRTTLERITKILSCHQICYHVTGGLASSFYGEPRFTQDIDLVVRLSMESDLISLVESISREFIINIEAVKDAVRRRSIFQALDEETLMKVDFHVGEAINGELERSICEEILPGLFVQLVSKEDAILSKLVWIKKGSHKSRQDVKMMLEQQPSVDLDKIRLEAKRLGLVSILEELCSDSEEGIG